MDFHKSKFSFFHFGVGALFFFILSGKNLSPSKEPPKHFRFLLQNLTHPDWNTRRITTETLISLGKKSLPWLYKAYKHSKAIEAKWRLRFCIETIEKGEKKNQNFLSWLFQDGNFIKSVSSGDFFCLSSKEWRIICLDYYFRDPYHEKVLYLLHHSPPKYWASFTLEVVSKGEWDKAYLFFEILAAKAPFKAKNALEILLSHSNQELQKRGLYLLGFFPKLMTSKIYNILMKFVQNKDPWIRAYALKALNSKKGKKIDLLLLKALKDSHPLVRKIVKLELRLRPFLRSIELYLYLLEQKDSQSKIVALKGLSILGERKVLPLIRENLDSTDPSIQAEAIMALGRYQDYQSIPKIIPFLHRKEPSLKLAALWALGKMGKKKVIPHLIRASYDKHPFIRKMAIESLSHYYDPRVLERFIIALDDPSPDVRWASIQGLRKWTGLFFGYAPWEKKESQHIAILGWKKWWRTQKK